MIPPVNRYPDLPDPEDDDRVEADGDRRSVLPLAIALVVAAAVVVGAVGVSVVTGRGDGDFGWFAFTPGEEPTASTDLSEVVVVEQPTTRHVDGDVTYDRTPPVGGDHDPAWLECGLYDEPVREENAVHSLEHGTVWVTYRSGLDEADLRTLAEAVPDESIVSPYDGLKAPVVVTVWGAQLALTGPDDPRLALFLAEYGDGHTSPEPFASCAGGVTPADSDPDSVGV